MPQFTVHQLELFEAVVAEGSFTRAAERLAIRQPAVSRQIRELEQAVGEPLLSRHHEGVTLTDEGRAFLEYAHRVVQAAAELDHWIANRHDHVAGRVVVGASTTPIDYYLLPVLSGFKRQFPGVLLEVRTGTSAQLVADVAKGALKLAVVGQEPDTPGVVWEMLAEDQIVPFVAADDPLAKAATLEASDLAGRSFVLREPGAATRQVADEALQRAGLTAHVSVELGTNEAVKRAVMGGLGLGLLSRRAIAVEVSVGMLKELKVPGLAAQRAIGVVWQEGALLNKAEQAFVDALRAGVSAGP